MGLILGPLIIFCIALMVVVAIYATKFTSKPYVKFITVALVFGVFFVLLFGDEIVGRYKFKQVCSDEGGVRVLKEIYLSPEYFNSNSVSKFYDESKIFDEMSLLGKYFGRMKKQNKYIKTFNIGRIDYHIYDGENNEIIATNTYFKYLGGWLKKKIGAMKNDICPARKTNTLKSFVKMVFKKT